MSEDKYSKKKDLAKDRSNGMHDIKNGDSLTLKLFSENI